MGKKDGVVSASASASAVAAQLAVADGKNCRYAVGVWNLRVMIVKEGPWWIAQGLEIDYVAQGASLPEVKKCFEEGLRGTINENLKQFETIENMLRPAPPSIFLEFETLAEKALIYSQISLHFHQLPGWFDTTNINYFADATLM